MVAGKPIGPYYPPKIWSSKELREAYQRKQSREKEKIFYEQQVKARKEYNIALKKVKDLEVQLFQSQSQWGRFKPRVAFTRRQLSKGQEGYIPLEKRRPYVAQQKLALKRQQSAALTQISQSRQALAGERAKLQAYKQRWKL